MASKRRVKRGDTKRRRWQLRQQGAVVDLTTATEVRMLAGLAPGESVATGASTLNGVCSIEAPATAGIIKEPTGGTGALGIAVFRVEFQITYGDGTTETIPDEGWELLEVLQDLGP